MKHFRIGGRDLPLFSVAGGVIHVTEFLQERLKRHQGCICLVGAKSASGKNFILKKICDQLPVGIAHNLDGDDWYYGEPIMSEKQRRWPGLNWDNPAAVDLHGQFYNLRDLARGQSTEKPCYQKATSTRGPAEKIPFKPIVFCGGNFALYDPAIRALGDLKIFITTSKHTRLIRRLLRDTAELGWKASDVIKYVIKTVEPMAKEFIEPTIGFADLIIENDLIPELEYLQTGQYHAQMKFDRQLSHEHLLKLGATLLNTSLQTDIYLQPDNLTLSASDEIVRIRNEGDKYYFSNKGPKLADCHFDRPKFSFEIDAEAALAISAFYKRDCTVIKKRKLYNLNGVLVAQDEDISRENGTELHTLKPCTEVQLSHSTKVNLGILYETVRTLGLDSNNNITTGYAAM